MENNEQKTNPILKGLKAFGHYLKFVFVDFFTSFKYNNMKLPAILVALPGILIGFFLVFHIPTIRRVIPSYTRSVEGSNASGKIALDREENGTVYYTLTVESGLKYNDKEYKNVVLNRKSDDIGTATRLTTPVLEEVTFENDKLSFTLTEADEATTALIDTYNVFVYQNESGADYIVQSYKKVAYGTELKFTDYSNINYMVAVQAVPKAADTEHAVSLVSNKVSFRPETKSASYDSNNYSLLRYAGNYVATSGLDDSLKSYEIDIKPNGETTILMNGAELTAKFGSTKGTTSFNLMATETVNILPFNYTGMVLFGLMLMGILNIFFALSISGKKNLGSVVKTSITTGIMVLLAVLYIYAVFATENLLKSGEIQISVKTIIDSDSIMSIAFIIAALVSSIAGCVLGFIFYDRNYEKVTF